MELLGTEIPVSYAIAGAIIIYVAVQLFRDRHLRHIPAVGFTFPILNWITSVRYIFNSRKYIEEGYEKYQSLGLFRVAVYDGWLIVVTSPKLVEQIRTTPESTVFFDEAIRQTLQVKYTLGSEVMDVPYHVDVLRGALTRNLGVRFDDLWDEIKVAFPEEIHAEKEWKGIPTIQTMQRVVARVSNRLLIDLPLCRDREWMQLNIDYAVDVAQGAMALKVAPAPFKPLVGWIYTKIKAQKRLANKLVGPIIQERLKDFAEQNEKWVNRPNDLISWLIEGSPPNLRTVPSLTNRLLMVNFASIHTSSFTFSNTLYRLASNPEWAEPLREEVERIVAVDGWSKAAIGKMHRVDSFFRETQRLNGVFMLTLQRWSLKPFTLSNGVQIPAGYQLTSAAEKLQLDPTYHGVDAATFDPWRWSTIREKESEALKHQMVNTESTMLNFGHGKHACPGRFFAAVELKAMLAHFVLEYDVRFKDGESVPPGLVIEHNVIPPEMQLEIRKRQKAE